MKRLLIIMFVAFVSVAATVRSDSVYVRAIILYGTAGEGKQVMAEFDEASALYGMMMRTIMGGGEFIEASKLKTRPCLWIAAIMLNAANRDVPSDLLDVNAAPVHYQYYPALHGERALIGPGIVMKPELVEVLQKYNEQFLKRMEYPHATRAGNCSAGVRGGIARD